VPQPVKDLDFFLQVGEALQSLPVDHRRGFGIIQVAHHIV